LLPPPFVKPPRRLTLEIQNDEVIARH